jgi:PTS system nitrogen regulatory IIA component
LPKQLVLLTELLSVDRVRIPLRAGTKDELLHELVEVVSQGLPAASADAIPAAGREREHVLRTGIGQGVAIPHGKTPVVDQLLMAAGVAARPVDFDALDGEPVELCFVLVGPESAAGAHVKALSRISRLLRRAPLREALRAAASPAEFLRLVRESETA